MIIARAQTDAEIQRCFPVLAELRPNLDDATFVADVRALEKDGYRLIFLEASGEVQTVAGYRIDACFAWGRFMYVYDLVTRSNAGRKGYGGAFMDWLVNEARARGCAELHLDSGVQRYDAHRFYFSHGLVVKSLHFSRGLGTE